MKKKRKHVRYRVHYVPYGQNYELHTADFKCMNDMVKWLIDCAPKVCFYILSIERYFTNENFSLFCS